MLKQDFLVSCRYLIPRGGERACVLAGDVLSVRNHKRGEGIALQFLHEYALSLSPLLAHTLYLLQLSRCSGIL